jgi:hypothetical protein
VVVVGGWVVVVGGWVVVVVVVGGWVVVVGGWVVVVDVLAPLRAPGDAWRAMTMTTAATSAIATTVAKKRERRTLVDDVGIREEPTSRRSLQPGPRGHADVRTIERSEDRDTTCSSLPGSWMPTASGCRRIDP